MGPQEWYNMANSQQAEERLHALKILSAHPDKFKDEVLFWFLSLRNSALISFQLYQLLSPEYLQLLEKSSSILTQMAAMEKEPPRNAAWLQLAESDDLDSRILAKTIILGDPKNYQWEIRDSFLICFANRQLMPLFPYEFYPFLENKAELFGDQTNFYLNTIPHFFDPKARFHHLKLAKDDLALKVAMAKALVQRSELTPFSIASIYRSIGQISIMQALKLAKALLLPWK